jgi:hypothetical protein
MAMPFTFEAFFEVFARYNTAVWPLQWVLLACGVGAAGAAVSHRLAWQRAALLVLAALWLWMAVVYHLLFFSRINPLAFVFAAVFVLQAVLLVWTAWRWKQENAPASWGTSATAFSLVLFACVAYPLLGYSWGHRFPAVPTFGTPCPTTIFTLGVLLLLPRPPLLTFLVPMLWAATGTSAALHLGVPQDFGLPAAALLAGLAIFYRGHLTRHARLQARAAFHDDRPQHAVL